MQSNQKIDICLEKQSYRFRWKSEVKSNANGDKVSKEFQIVYRLFLFI